MKRKAYEGSGVLPGMEEHMQPGEEAPARSSKRNPKQRVPRVTKLRVVIAALGLVFAAAGSLFAYHVTEDFLIRDPRFAVPSDTSSAQTIRISGAPHASVAAIENVFAADVGHSLYLVPLEDRLAALRKVAWVRDASIARVWPNRLLVQIEERVPVAFLALPNSRFALIDAEGYVMPPAQDTFNLPVLRGVKQNDPREKLRDSAERLIRLTRDLGADAMKDVSEIDVSQKDNIVVLRPYKGRLVKLMLGDRNFSLRYNNFVTHMSDIEFRVPGAKVLDMRLEDRITVVDSTEE